MTNDTLCLNISTAIILSGAFRLVKSVSLSQQQNILVNLGHLGEGELVVGGVNMHHQHLLCSSSEAAASTSTSASNNTHYQGIYESSLLTLEEYMTSEVILINTHEFLAKINELENCRRLFLGFLKSQITKKEMLGGVKSAIKAQQEKEKYFESLGGKYSVRKSPCQDRWGK